MEGKLEECTRQLRTLRSLAENRDREAKLSKKRAATLQVCQDPVGCGRCCALRAAARS